MYSTATIDKKISKIFTPTVSHKESRNFQNQGKQVIFTLSIFSEKYKRQFQLHFNSITTKYRFKSGYLGARTPQTH